MVDMILSIVLKLSAITVIILLLGVFRSVIIPETISPGVIYDATMLILGYWSGKIVEWKL